MHSISLLIYLGFHYARSIEKYQQMSLIYLQVSISMQGQVNMGDLGCPGKRA